jgi:hypothetical protein
MELINEAKKGNQERRIIQDIKYAQGTKARR